MSMRSYDTARPRSQSLGHHSRVYDYVDRVGRAGEGTGMGGKAAPFSSLGPCSQVLQCFHKGGMSW